MFIFRFEHDRDVCNAREYKEGGPSLTGHGPFSSACTSSQGRPNFGSRGKPPEGPMMSHERCAVSADQFERWISPTYNYPECVCYDYCMCSSSEACEIIKLNIPADWHLIAYWVEDSAQGTDWRYDNDQVIFNPAFAQRVGPLDSNAVAALTGKTVPA